MTGAAPTLPEVMGEIERMIRLLLEAHDHDTGATRGLVQVRPPPIPGVAEPCEDPLRLPSPGQSRKVPHMSERSDADSDSCQFLQVHMLDEWQKLADEQGSFRMNCRKSAEVETGLARRYKSSRWRRNMRGDFWIQCWAALSSLAILHDCVCVPLLAFGHHTFWLQSIQAVFWTINLLLLPLFLKRGNDRIFQDLSLLCSLEMALVVVMYVQLLRHSTDVASMIMDILRLIRVLQLPRLYSWTGLQKHVSSWMHQRSLEIRALVHLALSLLLGAYLLHLLTCLWFAVQGSSDGLQTAEQYVVTLEWALSRIHPVRTADNMLLPTQLERALALLASGVALLFGTMFVSLITNDLADIRRAHREQKESEYLLSDYLAIFPIPWDLEKQIKQFLHTKMASRQPPGKAEIAKLLPSFLNNEICCESLFPVLGKHEFLSGLCRSHDAFRHDLCVRGLQDWNVAPHEVLFSVGPKCPSMLIVAHGRVLYQHGLPRQPGQPAVDGFSSPLNTRALPVVTTGNQEHDSQIHALSREDWMCEHCLWTDWSYAGKAAADTRTTLISLSPEALTEISQHHRAATAELIIYARLFVNALKDVPEEDWSDLPFQVDLLF